MLPEISIHQRQRKSKNNKIVVKTFNIGDVEDPELYASIPLGQWEKTEHAQWCMEHSLVPVVFYSWSDFDTYGYRIEVVAEFCDEDVTFHALKWGVIR